MTSWEEIPDNRRLSESITVTVVDSDYVGDDNLEWRLQVEDKNGREFDFEIWTKHNVGIEWNTNHRYEVKQARGKVWNGGQSRKLSSTRDLQVVDLGPERANQNCKLLAISDTHIGYKHRESYDREWQADADGLASFKRAIRLAINQDVDAVIHAGDVFDDKGTPTDKEIEIVGNTLSDLGSGHLIPFYYITGNHEDSHGLDRMELSEPANEAIHLTSEGHRVYDTSVILYGIDYHKPSKFPSNPGFSLPSPSMVNILVLHQDLAPVRPNGNVDLYQLTSTGPDFDYIISGDLHDGVQLQWEDKDTEVLYTGATDHLSKKTYDTNPSAWLINIVDDEITVQRYSLDR